MCGCFELRDGTRLTLEALAELRIGGERVGQDLDRDGAVEPRVAGLVHLAHAAGAERRDDLVRAETGTRCEGHASVHRHEPLQFVEPVEHNVNLSSGSYR